MICSEFHFKPDIFLDFSSSLTNKFYFCLSQFGLGFLSLAERVLTIERGCLLKVKEVGYIQNNKIKKQTDSINSKGKDLKQ